MALGYNKQIGDSIINHPGQLLTLPGGKMSFLYIVPLVLGDWYLRNDERKLKTLKSDHTRKLVYLIIAIFTMWCFFDSDESASFIYFQF
jgi:hypothetical protein